MSDAPAARVLIVDDEPPAIERLTGLLSGMPGFEVAGCESRSGRVVDRCRQLQPDIVLLDIEMPGRNGLELARDLRGCSPASAIIFVTAHDDFALEAFGVAAVDYVVKPVRAERLIESLRRVIEARGDTPMLSGRLGERLIRVSVDDIRAFTSEDKCTIMHVNGRRILVEDALKTLEQRYPDRFVRIHRNALVSNRHLRALYHDDDDMPRVEIDGLDFDPEVSRRKLGMVKNILWSD